jgi:hypothetical protein
MIPDHRYCFDRFNNASSIVDVVLAHESEEINHSLRNFLEDRLTTGHNETKKYWQDEIGLPKYAALDFEAIQNLIEDYKQLVESETYIDVHAWKFTDQSFAEIYSTLIRWNLIDLALLRIFPAKNGNNEFWAIFQKPI